MRDVRDALMVARNSEGKLVARPISPHLQIYRWPLSMATSILHRVTGVALSVGTLLLSWWLIAAAVSDDAFAAVQWFLSSFLGVICLMGWALALLYHLCNGIRHMVWDVGWGFEKAEYELSARVVIGATAALTLLVWIIGLVVW